VLIQTIYSNKWRQKKLCSSSVKEKAVLEENNLTNNILRKTGLKQQRLLSERCPFKYAYYATSFTLQLVLLTQAHFDKIFLDIIDIIAKVDNPHRGLMRVLISS
jgi:hypothetical protein